MRELGLRILQIAHGVYPASQAGTEIYVAALGRALVDAGVELAVAVPSTRGLVEAQKHGLPEFVRPVAMGPGGLLGNKLRYATFRGPLWREQLRTLSAQFRPDVIHIQHACGFGLGALEFAAETGRPIVITLPDFWMLCPGLLNECGGDVGRCAEVCCRKLRMGRWPKFVLRMQLARRKRWMKRFVEGQRPVMAAISESTLREHEAQGFPAELMVKREWGIDTSAVAGARGVQRAREAEVRIGYLGSMRPHKGCHVLAEAFRSVRHSASLHFYGSGDEAYVAGLRRDYGGEKVVFHGRFDHSDVGRILGELDFVVIPSLWQETYCLVAQEAMAARRPVIATRVGGLADRIEHGVNGFLVEPDDVAGLAAEMNRVIGLLEGGELRLDYDRCLLDIKDDAREWIALYGRAIGAKNKSREMEGVLT